MSGMYNKKWSLPLGANGEKLEFIRDYACFKEGRAGKRAVYKTVEFSQEVVSAEVFLSGFNMWYTREGHDHEVMQLQVDAFIFRLGVSNPEFMSDEEIREMNRTVTVELMYTMTDEDISDDDDFNDSCIGFTVIAQTKPEAKP